MAKKKKGKRSKNKGALPNNPVQTAQTHMDAGRFRQAVDVYKTLCKNGQEQYLPRLKAAYEGLYRQRLAKDQFEQAAMVLDQLEKQFPGAACASAVTLHLHQNDYPKAAAVAVDLLQQQVSCRESDEAAGDLADALVLAFEPGMATEKLSSEIRRDLNAVWSALEHMTAGRYDQAREEIKPVGMRSLFSHWKWFIKGMGFFYEQMDAKAVQAFERINADSVPGRAAVPYLKLLQDDPWSEVETKNAGLMEMAALIAGYGSEAAALARAEYLWQVNRLRDSLAHLQRHLDDFPTWRHGLMGSLTQLYYNTCLDLSPENAIKYLDYLQRSARQSRHSGEAIWVQRTAALISELAGINDYGIVDLWETFIDSYGDMNDGSERLARSLVYKRLGDIFTEEKEQDDPFLMPFFRPRNRGPNLRNPELAEQCYRKSIAAAPDALAPQLALAAFYEKNEDKSALNRLLDRLIRQFPDEKNVLAKAGGRCVQRNAFIKAMKYLERALTLDPMDHLLREAFIVAAIKAALQYCRKGNGAKARDLLPRALEMAGRQSDDFNCGQAYLFARWAAMEMLLDNGQQAESLWGQAAAAHFGSEVKLHLFFLIIAGAYGVGRSELAQRRADIEKTLKKPFGIQTAIDCVQVLQYTGQIPKPHRSASKLTSAIDAYLKKGATHAMTKAQAATIVAYLISPEADRPDIAQLYIKHRLKSDPDDAQFRYWQFLIKTRHASFPFSPAIDIEELRTILRLAREQREMDVAAAVQKVLNDLEEMAKVDDIFERVFFDEDDDFDDMDEEGGLMDDDDDDPFEDAYDVPIPSLPAPKSGKKAAKKNDKKNPNTKPPEQLSLF